MNCEELFHYLKQNSASIRFCTQEEARNGKRWICEDTNHKTWGNNPVDAVRKHRSVSEPKRQEKVK